MPPRTPHHFETGQNSARSHWRPHPEEELAYKQEMDALQAVFADRPDAQLVLMGRAEGLKGADLAEFAELNASQLATVQRLIARRLAGYRRDE